MENYFRKNIQELIAYSSARDEYTGAEGVFLDANENPFETGFNRYPDPYQRKIKEKLAELKNINSNQLLLGNGSDECIDLLLRSFCEPKEDAIMIQPPTYGMYQVSAAINAVEVQQTALNMDFQPDWEQIKINTNRNTKIIFFCSPNNPSGNSFSISEFEIFLAQTKCIVVVDEAYIDFCKEKSAVELIKKYPNLIVLQTLSKAYGLASLRLGLLIADPALIAVLNKVKPPYNISGLTQEMVLLQLNDRVAYESKLKIILNERNKLMQSLNNLSRVEKVYASDANFLLVKFSNADQLYQDLLKEKIIVRNRSNQLNCENCLRITIGTPEENIRLINSLRKFN